MKMSLEETSEALDYAPDAIIVLGFTKQVIFLNHAAEQMFGYRADDVAGRDLDTFIPGVMPIRDSHNPSKHLDQLGSRSKTIDMLARRRDGSTFPVEASVATVDEGKGEMCIFAFRDISERKKSEAKLRSLIEECDASKVGELLLIELRHRMRNNLQTIISMIRLEKARPITTEAKAELELMENRIVALNGVDGELLVGAETQPVELGGYVRRLAAALRNIFEPRAVPLYLSIQTEPIEVAAATAARIGLLINEAVTNSFKHAAPKGATEISLKLIRQHDIISIEIVDNGPGFDDKPSEPAGGIDLMQKLVQQMGGTIQIDGHEGTRCKISLPIGKVV